MAEQVAGLPRLSPIGWSIDETSDLHAAVFDIATGGSSFLGDGLNDSLSLDRPPLTERSDSTRLNVRNDSSSLDVPSLSQQQDELPVKGGRDRRISSAQLPPRRPKTSDRARSNSFLASSVKTLRRAASRDALRTTDGVPTGEGEGAGSSGGGRLARAPSMFRLKRPFANRSSSYRSNGDLDSSAAEERAVASSSAPATQTDQQFSLLISTPSNRSGATEARASSEHGAGQGDIKIPAQTRAPSSASSRARLSVSTSAFAGDSAAGVIDSTDAPLLSSRSSSSGGSSAALGSFRRRRGHPPLQAAPNVPLPPLPPAVKVESRESGILNDSGPRQEEWKLGDEAAQDARKVRKARSQTGLGVLRTRTILGGLRNTSAEKVLIKRAPQATQWDAPMTSRLDMMDSSPEMERASLAPSEEWLRNNASTPSLEEARMVLDTSRLDAISRVNNAQLSAPHSSQESFGQPSPTTQKSRLESNGGVGALFGGSGPTANPHSTRSRASSLLPWRQRASSSAHIDTPSAGESSNATSSRSSADKSIKISVEGFSEHDVEAFLQHVTASAPRTDIPGLLAASGDPLHKKALQLYMQQFLFAGHPLDVALRKLLMTLCLPKETQQIDRVMEAFARRYNECNESLFVSHDQPYMLAFSLMMLHTDTFNRNAKQKMTKADYVRNTSASGVVTEVLEYLYDNLTFTQFIYVEDDDFLRRRKSDADSTSSALRAAFTPSNSSVKDPYQIIASGQTHTLRPAVHIDEDTPFSATGTSPGFDIESLLTSFVNAPSIEIVTARKAPLPSAAAALGGYYSTLPSVSKEEESIVTLRVTKVGCVSRKDDLLEDNKKAGSRKWKTCGMILSASQLLFFRDLVWTSALDQRIAQQLQEQPDKEGGVVISPKITYFKPDGVLALGDAVAVKDSTYSKYNHVFRLLARHGDVQRQYLIQTASEEEMNDWIHKINFCAAFRSAGLHIRGLDVGASDSSNPATPNLNESGTADVSPLASPGASVDSPNTAVPLVGLLRRKLNARLREFQPVIDRVTQKLEESQSELDDRLRFARHIMISTPFLRSTRERLEAVATPLAQEVRQLRLEVARYGCRREILLLELEAGNRAAKASAPAASFDPSAEKAGSNFGHPWSPPSLPDSSFNSSSNGLLNSSRSSSQNRAASVLHQSGSFNLPPPALGKSATNQKRGATDPGQGVQTTPTLGTIHLRDEQKEAIEASSTAATPSSSFLTSSTALPSMHFTPLGLSYANSKDSGLSSLATSTQHSVDTGSPKSKGGVGKRSFFKGGGGHNSSPHDAEEQERWDRTKMGRDADKRISLVMNLPESQQWQTLVSKRIAASPTTEKRNPSIVSSSIVSTKGSQKKPRSQRSSSISASSSSQVAAERRGSAAKDLSRLYG